MWHNHPLSQSEKQDIKNTSEREGWKPQERGVGQNFGGISNIEGGWNPLPIMCHK